MTTPQYPPARIVIEVPFDSEPYVVDDGGFAHYFIEAICNRVAIAHSTTWEMTEEDS